MGLVVFAALMVFGLAALRMTMSSSKANLASNEEREATALAEAGLNEAMNAVRAGGSGSLGSMNWPVAMGEGLFWVDATDLGNNRVQLVATGMLGSGRSALEVVVERPTNESPLFEAVINSDNNLSMASGTFSDSYRSSLGTYASQAVNTTNGFTHANTEGTMRSNGSISIGGVVFGDATPGPGRTASVSGSAYLHGSDAPAEEPFLFSPIEFPGIPQAGSYDVPEADSAVLPSGEYGFSDMTLGSDSKLRIEGPATILLDNFDASTHSRLEIDARLGPVAFYCRQDYSQEAGFEAVAVGDAPLALAFLVDGKIKFSNDSIVRGGFYAPYANLTLSSGSEIFGALAVSGLTMANGVRFHYDEDLRSYFMADTGQQGAESVTMLAWFEREVTPVSLRFNRGDPFEVLGVDRSDSLSVEGARELDLQKDPPQY